jgi:hypothetical protein
VVHFRLGGNEARTSENELCHGDLHVDAAVDVLLPGRAGLSTGAVLAAVRQVGLQPWAVR